MQKISIEVYGLLASLDCYIIDLYLKIRLITWLKQALKHTRKKLKELTRNVVLPFTPAETVLSLSDTKLMC